MDINRNSRTTPMAGQPSQSSSTKKLNKGWAKIMKLASVVLLFSSTILIVALLFSFVFSDNRKQEGTFVDTQKMQAVFMSGGQVYFGKITNLNNRYITLQDIYYLQVKEQVQPGEKAPSNNIQLTKLGCELHAPQDLMIIKQDQVIFWENLRDDGPVAKKVVEFKAKNPNWPQCEYES